MMEKLTLTIQGMTCKNCVAHVTEALASVADVKTVKVNLKKGEAIVKGDAPNMDSLKAAVSDAGYQVV